jgi:dTDP-4-dehydrorhamnose 3,5-epimerase
MSNELKVSEAEIPGMYVIELVMHNDSRGWFKESYQAEKLEKLGLPHFEIVQNNFSYNQERGVTRGLHAEPWEKYISLASGRVFGAWVDLRPGDSYGKVFTKILTPSIAIFLPRGVANAYQTIDENTVYTYLVNAHWSLDADYSSINLFDPELKIDWPIDQSQAIISDKDRLNPQLKDISQAA